MALTLITTKDTTTTKDLNLTAKSFKQTLFKLEESVVGCRTILEQQGAKWGINKKEHYIIMPQCLLC